MEKLQIKQSQSIDIFSEAEIVSELSQKILRVIGYKNMIDKNTERIGVKKVQLSEGMTFLYGMDFRVQFQNNVIEGEKMQKRLKKSYYDALESLQLQIEKEKHTKNYFER